MKGEILQIKTVLPHWETDHTETVAANLIAGIVYDFEHDDGVVEEDVTTSVRPGENDPFATKLIEETQNWLDAGGVIPEWVPPTVDELRAAMTPLSRRQFRRGLLKTADILPGKQKVTSSDIEAVIALIPDDTEREEAEIDWQDAAQFERMNPLVVTLSVALGFTPEEVDTLWQAALQI